MLSMTLRAVRSTGLSLVPIAADETILITVSGNCDMETTPLFDQFLESLHKEACRVRPQRVAFDCESLYFMNSTSLKLLVTFLAKVKQLDPNDRYSVHFKANPQLTWQHRSFGAVRRFASDLVRIE